MKVVIFFMQIAGLVLINKLGFYLVDYFNLMIPGNVAGLIILFLLLWSKIIKLEWIEQASDYLVKHLSFFFVSISVGLMTLGGMLAKNGLELAAVIIISAVIGISFAAISAHLLSSRKEGAQTQNVYNDI